ncbi:L-amino acid N-acyltransferase YncA [Pseudonocardia sediminis]|uniref:L-amino acid N-acyltransferase YncA n=1 Tax=Pseudonocardia sediminis TaxID=1397368 RepID=A0A4Q7UTM2_PSEST|nr:L-amino acid N-acyltransferase YncA [Pseudonocardia sediminis]
MEIREATAEDWPHIWAFLREVFAQGRTYAVDREIGEDAARALWMPPLPWRTVVAVDGGRVVGSAKYGPNRDGPGAHVANASFAVDAAAAGRGTGRALGTHVLDRAREQGFDAMVFNAVVQANTRAVGLWRSLGFDVVGTVPEAFRLPDGTVTGIHVMHRRL